MPLATRQPTGKPPWPITLIAGGEKTGKSYASAQASASDLIDRTFWFGVGEDDPDEYGALPGARFEIVPHSGAYADILDKLKAAVKEPAAEGKQNLIIIDSGTRLWEMLSDEAGHRATARAKRSAEKYKKPFDSDTEVTIGTDLWNKATDRWRAIMDQLRDHAGPSIITARLDVVTVMDAQGKPTKDKTSKVKAQKSLPFDVGVVIEMPERGKTFISGARSLKLDLPVGEKAALPDFTMDSLWRNLGITGPEATSQRQHSHADGAASAQEDEGAPQRAPQQPNPPISGPTQADDYLRAAQGNLERLTALRVWANNAGAPDEYKTRITEAINALNAETPIEGVVQQ